MAERNEAEDSTASSRGAMEDVPPAIELAIRVAASTQSCKFTGRLSGPNELDEFSIEACIGRSEAPLIGPRGPLYKVRFLIPSDFPYRVVETVPLDPPLKWYPHQMGDWGDTHANIICPPSLDTVYGEELLRPYISHAYRWIEDALAGTLTAEGQHYEFPHIRNVAGERATIYAEGGTRPTEWVRRSRSGIAWLTQVNLKEGSRKAYLVRRLSDQHGENSGWALPLRRGVFGREEEAGWAPWVFVGDPVVEAPHRPATSWEDLNDGVRKRLLAATREACRRHPALELLLIAFEVPELIGMQPDRIVWAALKLKAFDRNALSRRPQTGSFREKDYERWPAVRSFVDSNQELAWVGRCIDVSKGAVVSRSGIELGNVDVAIVGIGALGSTLARGMAALHPRRVYLFDHDTLEPGNLIRHEALNFQVGHNKAEAIGGSLTPLYEDEVMEGHRADVIKRWPEVRDQIARCSLVVDATANAGVHSFLLSRSELLSVATVICYIKPGPDFGVLFLRRAGSDATLDSAHDRLFDGLAEDIRREFEATDQRLVWPEEGCYYPTFPAPFHRMRMMADSFLEVILSWLVEGQTGDLVTLFRQKEGEGVLGIETQIIRQVEI